MCACPEDVSERRRSRSPHRTLSSTGPRSHTSGARIRSRCGTGRRGPAWGRRRKPSSGTPSRSTRRRSPRNRTASDRKTSTLSRVGNATTLPASGRRQTDEARARHRPPVDRHGERRVQIVISMGPAGPRGRRVDQGGTRRPRDRNPGIVSQRLIGSGRGRCGTDDGERRLRRGAADDDVGTRRRSPRRARRAVVRPAGDAARRPVRTRAGGGANPRHRAVADPADRLRARGDAERATGSAPTSASLHHHDLVHGVLRSVPGLDGFGAGLGTHRRSSRHWWRRSTPTSTSRGCG